ncbi:receptor-like protein 12 [Arachis ipaensis]|uniref:receptor-like protein 12 n=1 Tax=Arachis ipaensis TaxID=130454 RepID=UPI0007AF6EA4|nr:receptor-like protein 12 [Arachis ipaensis]XP_025667252.1 receptor-like protein 9DC3 [Arachis hypogaea]
MGYLMLLVVRVVLCVYMFMMFHFACLSSSHLCHSQDSSALLHFKTQFIFNPSFFEYKYYYEYEYESEYEYECPHVYPKMSTWENGTDCCSWMGVTCHSVSGHVIGLDLSCGALVGNIHPNSTLFHLTHLQTLNLAFNFFNYSPLSSQFGRFVSLTHLNLSHCQFNGEIPPQISHLSKLQSLDLSRNYDLMWKETSWKRMLQNATALREIVLDETDMSSISLTPNPLSNWSFSFSLVTLSLGYTEIRGYLTSHILCLPNLYELKLDGNEDIQVHVPKLNCSTSLSFLDLSSCQSLGSQIPDSFSNLTQLTFLDLSDNGFNGSIPSLLSNLQHLTYLDLSFNAFTGSFPSFLSNLHHLVYLDLSLNTLSGQIPNVFDRLTNLQSLGLSNNNFQRKLPSSLFALTQLSSLDCSNNEIEGPLPDKVAFLNLTQLYLNGNLLNGTIPQWALSLKSLRSLDLSNNRFTGHINEITSYSLEYLDLCNNKLQGNVPESIFDLVNLSNLCLSPHNWSDTVHFSLFSRLQKLSHLSLSGCNSLVLGSETSVNYTFSNLQALQLRSNNIIGYSTFSGNFSELEFLELSNSKLEGKVPQWIHGIDSLHHLILSNNSLTSMGQFSWYQLEDLDLSFNLMDDDISSFFCNATSLRDINLSHNRFTGTFPQCLANSSSTLEHLDLQMNKLHGNFPDTLNGLQLGTLILNDNQFEGLLPKSLSNSLSLQELNLGNNQFEDTFPYWLQNISLLEILVLRSNKLYGPIANLKSKIIFPSLKIFDISCNNFSGSFPKAYIQNFQAMKIVDDEVLSSDYYFETPGPFGGEGIIEEDTDHSMTSIIKGVSTTFTKIPRVFVNIDLSINKFEGEIPSIIGELQALKGLNLSHNKLVGHIPYSLGNLTNLESLDLSSNMLTGNIPTELTNLNFLEVLNLSQNQLVGPIPKGKQFDTFSNDSYEGNMGLCGLPLSIQCNNNVPLQQYPPSSEAEDKFGFGWKPVAIGYACGMVLGIGLGCCVFSIGKPQWLVIIFGGKRIKRRRRGNRHARTT